VIHQAALAIRARIPISTLLDQVAQFPTYSEGYLAALEVLAGLSRNVSWWCARLGLATAHGRNLVRRKPSGCAGEPRNHACLEPSVCGLGLRRCGERSTPGRGAWPATWSASTADGMFSTRPTRSVPTRSVSCAVNSQRASLARCRRPSPHG
jgi:hypothetical protein